MSSNEIHDLQDGDTIDVEEQLILVDAHEESVKAAVMPTIDEFESDDSEEIQDGTKDDLYVPPSGIEIDPIEKLVSVTESVSYLKGLTDSGDAILSLARTTLGDILARSEGSTYTSEDLAKIHGSAEAVAKWEAAVGAAIQEGSPERDRFFKRTYRSGSKWDQTPSHEGKNILPNRPKIGSGGTGELLSGEAAILYMTAMTTPGAHLQVPLWNSGIWVTMKQPSLSSDTEFIQRLLNERISLGRSTRGVLFSNDNIFTVGFLYDYILAHVFQTTAKVSSMQDLRNTILSTDLPILAWGMALLLNPTGFPFSQPCTYDPTKCVYVAEDMIAISKLLWVDMSRLSEHQLKHMATKARNVDIKTIEEYQAGFVNPSAIPNTVTLTDSKDGDVRLRTHLVLQVPTLEAQIQIGRQWVNDIVVMTERAFGEKLTGQNRDVYMASQARNTACRRYSHWVKEIIFTKGETQQRITDRDSIEAALQTITSNKEVFGKYMKGIDEFIEDQGVAIVGFPNYACPACGNHHLTPEPKQTIVPIDPVSVFLVLQRYRLESTSLE